MELPRRHFLKSAGGMLAASAWGHAFGSDEPAGFPDVRPLLIDAGFNPSEPGAALLAVAADFHIYLDPASPGYNDRYDDGLVNELNGLTPAISHLVLAGDLAVSHSVTAGSPRYPASYAIARQELRTAREQMDRFRAGMELHAIPGNHDTDNLETDAELWREEMQIVPYRRLTLGGVPVLLLNSGHAGALDPAQEQWLEAEAAGISPDQEVLIVAHHPSLYHMAGETGLKYSLARIFRNHREMVWIIGGHGHLFEDQLFINKGVKFIQMEVTSGSRKVFNDGKASGYALLGLSGGRLRARVYRSIHMNFFTVRPKPAVMTPAALRWPFDRVAWPALLCLEGRYDRTGLVHAFLANDVRKHFLYVQYITYRLDLARFRGKARTFLVHAGIAVNVLASMSCSFSATGADGTWTSLPFPASDGSCTYRIPIPDAFLGMSTVYVKVATSITRFGASLTVEGWGLEARTDLLTGYEKWLSRTYRTIVSRPETLPGVIPPGSTFTNAVHFAFNLPVPDVATDPSTPDGNPGGGQAVSGEPAVTTEPAAIRQFSFARRRASTQPGIEYIVEESDGLGSWQEVGAERLAVEPLDATWEEVRLSRVEVTGGRHFHRVKVEPLPGATGLFQTWPGFAMAPGGTPDDHDADGVSDIIDFAFDLGPGGHLRRYDRSRTANPAGLPVMVVSAAPRTVLTFVRMKASANPGVYYRVESSAGGSIWQSVQPSNYHESVIDETGDWEKVQLLMFGNPDSGISYRVRIELSEPMIP